MTVYTFQILSVPLLLTLGFISGVFPLLQRVNQENRGYFGIANAGAGGVFLGSGLLHMLPDSEEGFSELEMTNYPYNVLFMGIGFFLTMILELFLSPGHEAIIEIGAGSTKDSPKQIYSSSETTTRKPFPLETTGEMVVTEGMLNTRGQNYKKPLIKNTGVSKRRWKHDKVFASEICRQGSPSPFGRMANKNSLANTDYEKPLIKNTGVSNKRRKQDKVFASEICRQGSPSPFHRMANKNSLAKTEIAAFESSEKLRGSIQSWQSQNSRKVIKDEHSAKAKRPGIMSSPATPQDDLRIGYNSRIFELGYNLARDVSKTSVPPLQFPDDDDHLSAPKLTAIILVVILSVHSFVTGLATGSSDVSRNGYMIIILALCVHKIVAAMSLGITVKKADWTLKKGTLFVLVFSISTPTGIAVGLLLEESMKDETTKEAFTSVAMALGSGSFVYLAIMENIVEEFVESRSNRKCKLICCLVGFALMAVLALFN